MTRVDGRTLGMVLRMFGPLMQIVSLIVLLQTPSPKASADLAEPRNLALGGFFAGFLLVVAGVFLSRRPGGRGKGPSDPLG